MSLLRHKTIYQKTPRGPIFIDSSKLNCDESLL